MVIRMMRVFETVKFKCAGQWPLAGVAVWMLVLLQPSLAADKSIEKKTKIHRLSTTKRAVYDAFAYVNRIPEQAEKEESPQDFAGRIFSRLANQEGRVLIKLPQGLSLIHISEPTRPY